MSSKNITINLTDEELKRLEFLVNFFQNKSIATVTRSDVIKFLINKVYTLTYGENNLDKAREFYKTLGIDFDFEVLNFEKLNKLK